MHVYALLFAVHTHSVSHVHTYVHTPDCPVSDGGAPITSYSLEMRQPQGGVGCMVAVLTPIPLAERG